MSDSRSAKSSPEISPEFSELFYSVKDKYEDLLLDDEQAFLDFLNEIEKNCFEDGSFINTDQYIPLLVLADYITTLSKDSVAHYIGRCELSDLVKAFCDIGKKSKKQEVIGEYMAFNKVFVVHFFNGVIKSIDPNSVNAVTYQQAQSILAYHDYCFEYYCNGKNKAKFRDIILRETNAVLFKHDSNEIKREALASLDSKLRTIRAICQRITDVNLQDEMIDCLLNANDEIINKLIASFLKDPDLNLKYIEWFQIKSFINAINKHKKDSDDPCLLAVSNLIDDYNKKDISLKRFVDICTILAGFHSQYICADSKEEKFDGESLRQFSTLFTYYSHMLRYADVDETLKQLVEELKKTTVVLDHHNLMAMKMIKEGFDEIIFIDRQINNGVMNDAAIRAMGRLIIDYVDVLLKKQKSATEANVESDQFSDFVSVAQCLEKAWLIRMMKYKGDVLLAESVKNLDLLDVSYYSNRYRKLLTLEKNITNRNDSLSNAARMVYRDAKAVLTHALLVTKKSTEIVFQLDAMLASVNDLMRPHPNKQSLTDLMTQIDRLPRSPISNTRLLISSLCIFAGIATLAVGFALSPLTGFTSAYLGIKAASMMMAAGFALSGGTAVSYWNTRRPSSLSVVKSLGGFIKEANKVNFDDFKPVPAAGRRV